MKQITHKGIIAVHLLAYATGLGLTLALMLILVLAKNNETFLYIAAGFFGTVATWLIISLINKEFNELKDPQFEGQTRVNAEGNYSMYWSDSGNLYYTINKL